MAVARGFFHRDTVSIARDLIGARLVYESGEGIASGIIVETEAYLRDDPACHASRGMTKRNASMFKAPGHAYVYFVYGNHFCFNVVTAEEGIGEAVLIRALEPAEGKELMASRRGTDAELLLASGPGRLCRAMGIDGSLDGAKLWEKPLYIEARGPEVSFGIRETKRIGVSRGADVKLRFCMEGSSYLSRKL